LAKERPPRMTFDSAKSTAAETAKDAASTVAEDNLIRKYVYSTTDLSFCFRFLPPLQHVGRLGDYYLRLAALMDQKSALGVQFLPAARL
jgi:hypothetical protein